MKTKARVYLRVDYFSGRVLVLDSHGRPMLGLCPTESRRRFGKLVPGRKYRLDMTLSEAKR